MEMFDWNKQADETSPASAQGIEIKGIEESVQQESSTSLSIQGPELSGLPVMQSRQGYCSCCHVHYNNLEQHVYSSQHRHFATYCRNRMGTTSLMERFLQDVLQHHPYRYQDNRPTYDDMPFASFRLPRDEAFLSLDLTEKEGTVSRGEEPSTNSGFTAESGCLISQRSHEELKNTFVPVTPTQRLESGKEPILGTSKKYINISCSTKNPVPVESAVTETRSHKAPNAAVNLLPCPLPVSHLPLTPHIFTKNTKHSIIPDSVSSNQCEQNKHGICNQDGLINPHLSPLLQSDHSRTIPLSCKGPACNQGNSVISGQLYWKEDGLQPQDETQISDFCLRNTSNPVSTSSSLAFQASSQLTGKKESKMGRSAATSIDEIIEEVILKYCYETPPKDFLCRDDDTNSSINILSLLDHSSVHGSDISFDCDAAVQSGAFLSKATIKSVELLKEAQVTLKDENYGTQLSSILRNDVVQQTPETEKDVSAHNEEPVLPALPHVPPSFVGKTWSQIMQEDDMKIEVLVRDFREGRFRCHFDTESLANCARKRLSKKKMKEEERVNPVASNKKKAMSAKGLPEFTEGLSSDFSISSAISETQHIPETLRRPKKRNWRLASRCQVVKVSHGTQTSLVHYPVVKPKIIRKNTEPPDQKANFVWPDSEKTPAMKTRLCALKLPESYTKIMSPVQPQTVVYVLSCPEIKPFKSKAEDFPKVRRSCHSADSKDSIRYKYKQSCIKYYDPLTNRILKTPPKSLVGEKARKPPHVRQLFRSLSLDANSKKQASAEYEFMTPKPFSSTDQHSSSPSSMLHPVKENDMNSSHNTEGSSVSLGRPECLVCSTSEKSYNHLVLSSSNPQELQQEDDFRLTPFNITQVPSPLKSHVAECLGRDNPKRGWQRKKGSNRESGFSKKASAPAFVRHNCIRRGNKVQVQPCRTTAHQKEGGRRTISTCSRKPSRSSIPKHQAMKTTVGKHLKKEKADTKKLKVARKPKRTFLNTTGIIGISEKRQKTTARASSKVKKWELTGEKSLLRTVK
ncbi:DBF4-type zinc finger-containing protein 2 isoform X1 [Pogona vitticeps]